MKHEPDVREIADPLSETTRSERRWLLVSSVTLVALTWGGLVPGKVDAFGMEISNVNASILVLLAFAVTVYFLLAFIYYYRADRFGVDAIFALHKKAAVDTFSKELLEIAGLESWGSKEREERVRGIYAKRFGSPLRQRYLFDFWSALVIAVASLIAAGGWLICRAI